MVEKLPQNAAFDGISRFIGSRGQQLRKGIRRRIDGGAVFLFQPGQLPQMLLGALVKCRAHRPCLAIGAPQQQRCCPVLQAAPESVIGNPVLKLPPCQDHTHIRRQIEGTVTAGTHPALHRVGHTAFRTPAEMAVGQQHRQKRQIIIEDHAAHHTEAAAQRMT